MKNLFQTMTMLGRVERPDPKQGQFTLRLLNGDQAVVTASPTTYYEVLKNLGADASNRVPEPSADDLQSVLQEEGGNPMKRNILKYLDEGRMVSVTGIYMQNGDHVRFDARRVVLMHSDPEKYGFEETHWWLHQVGTLFEQWLDVLFGENRELTVNDFASKYRTDLDLLGGKVDNVAQECATMSRFLYGLSSSYLLTGNERALSAAHACAQYLMEGFAMVSHDRRYCFWKFGRVWADRSTRDIVPSQNWDDRNSFALYEQIYALSGLAQYYRITQDTRVLGYLRMTIAAFQDFYHDTKREGDSCFRGEGGYFSHIDAVTMRPDSPALNVGDGYDNVRKKNWNSIGDHIPAYMVNLLLAIDPLPKTEEGDWAELREVCRKILDDCVENILDHFFTPDSAMVNERFDANWKQDLDWGWQGNRGIVGHNLKISWNLTRCGHYYLQRAADLRAKGSTAQADGYDKLAQRCYTRATELADKMDVIGVDQVRGGIWDALERKPNEQGIHEFAWGSTKDFWQQEQAILAYYILHGIPNQDKAQADRFLELARACTSFWNEFFLDHDNRKVYFRTDDSGVPVIQGQYGIQAGHAIAGYHAFELNYLAHLYVRTYVSKRTDDNFSLVFRPTDTNVVKTLNVLPDFLPPGAVRIHSVRVDGVELDSKDFREDVFQIDVSGCPNGARIEVEFRPLRDDADTADQIDAARPAGNSLRIFR